MFPDVVPRIARVLALLSIFPAIFPASALAMEAAVNPAYDAGWAHRLVFGSHWRDVWSARTPIPTLELDGPEGLLKPLKKGGGYQTQTLHFESSSGRRWKFRSIDKRIARTLLPDLEGTGIESVLQDQISSSHPGGSLMVPVLARKAGILEAQARLVRLPDDEKLGPFRAEFGGLIGTIEEHFHKGSPSLPPGSKVADTAELFAKATEGKTVHFDAEAFLKARLLDIWVSDWDRHHDQWRWYGVPQDGGGFLWKPIPRDRDQSFSRLDGVMPWIFERFQPEVASFGKRFSPIQYQVWTASHLDRRILSRLDRESWERVTRETLASWNEGAVDEALAQLPTAWRDASAETVREGLIARLGRLEKASRDYYDHLAGEVDVHGSDGSEEAQVEDLEGGKIRVKLVVRRKGESVTTFDRVFDPKETREIRLLLGKGEDQVLWGARKSSPILVRAVGDFEEKADRVARMVPDPVYDRLKLESRKELLLAQNALPPTGANLFQNEEVAKGRMEFETPRDFGSEWRPNIRFETNPDTSLLIGGGPTYIRYGYGKFPYDYRIETAAAVALFMGKFKADVKVDKVLQTGAWGADLRARGSQLEILRYYGFGNGIQRLKDIDDEEYRLNTAQVILDGGITWNFCRLCVARVGIDVSYTHLNDALERERKGLPNFDAQDVRQIKWRLSAELDTGRNRDNRLRAFKLGAEVLGNPGTWDTHYRYVRTDAWARKSFVLFDSPLSVIELGVNVARIWGDFPFFEAPTLGGQGGPGSVRGLPLQRYTGDGMVRGSFDARVALGKYKFLVPGSWGPAVFADIGRVFSDVDRSLRFEYGVGGGLWASVIRPENTVSILVAKSLDMYAFYLQTGLNF